MQLYYIKMLFNYFLIKKTLNSFRIQGFYGYFRLYYYKITLLQ